jgi:putative peptidoglycan lipid II flippase
MNSLIWGLGGVTGFVAMLGMTNAEWLIHTLNPNASDMQLALPTKLARVTWLFLPLSALSAIYTAGLHVKGRFAAATILPIAPICGSLVVCLLGHIHWGVETLVWGQLLGYAFMLAGLRLAYGASSRGNNWRGMSGLLAKIPMTGAALIIFSIYPFSDAIWGSRIGPAAVSYLGYAQRLIVGFSGLAVVGATTVIFPRLASKAAEGKHDSMREDLGLSLRVMLVCMAPASALFAVVALPTLQVLFQRGVFSLTDAHSLAALLPFMLIGMVAMSCMGLVFKALFARGELRAATGISVFGATLYFVLSGLLAGKLGIAGVGLAYALSWWLTFGLGIIHIWRGELDTQTIRNNLAFAIRLSIGAVLTVCIGWLGAKLLPPEDSADFVRRLLVLAGTALSAIGFYLVIGNGPLALHEVRLITKKVFALINRP